METPVNTVHVESIYLKFKKHKRLYLTAQNIRSEKKRGSSLSRRRLFEYCHTDGGVSEQEEEEPICE